MPRLTGQRLNGQRLNGQGQRNTLSPEPDWPTTMRSRLADGRVVGVDGSVWLYMAVPMAPYVDAADEASLAHAAAPVGIALDALGGLASVRVARRSVARSSYREAHILVVNIPERFAPSPDSQVAPYLVEAYPSQVTERRLCLFGVRLVPHVGAGGARETVESVANTLLFGGSPMSYYERDFADVRHVLVSSGLTAPTTADFNLANAWWMHGRDPGSPFLVHSDHLHVFEGLAPARAAARLRALSCEDWPDMAGHSTLTFGCTREWDLPDVDEHSTDAMWVPALLNRGAVCISVRGRVEPPKVTRQELRRHRKQYVDDINERLSQGKLERAEQEEMLQGLTQIEGLYSDQRAPATLTDCSVVVAFSGRSERNGYDLSDIGAGAGMALSTLVDRQRAAMAECWLASKVRANPYLHDLPGHVIAAAGFNDLSVLGDRDGALVGFTERDRQPAYVSPVAASVGDALPILSILGATGSGKSCRLSTRIPTPNGWTTMGELTVGDSVFGRDGKPCTVTYVSSIDRHPDLYRVSFSDRQEIYADRDHQWVVSSFYARNRVRHPKRKAALARWADAHRMAERLEGIAANCRNGDITLGELVSRLRTDGFGKMWHTKAQLIQALDFVGCPYRSEDRTVPWRIHGRVVKTDPVVLFPLGPTLRANLCFWQQASGGNAVRWREQLDSKIRAARTLLAAIASGEMDDAEELTAAELARRLRLASAYFPQSSRRNLALAARQAGVQPRHGHAEVVIDIPERDRTIVCNVRVYDIPQAYKSLALRLRQQYAIKPFGEAPERVMTTGEMLAEGVRLNGGNARFAVRLAASVDLPDADLPVPPYVLGAWLGDGGSWGGQISQGNTEGCTDPITGQTDQELMIEQLRAAGYEARALWGQLIGTSGLMTHLRDAGVLRDKHVPPLYLRASSDQRLALLQGLMDTDGTVNKQGCCEVAFNSKKLATGVLELIRSLGLKASISRSASKITEPDPQRPGHKRRRVTGTRWRIKFTTTMAVFRLPRKARRLPTQVRETQGWLYVTDITPVAPEPARCIQVNSLDGTYLAEGFIPTHNTVAALHIAYQFSQMRNHKGQRLPVVFVDPKQQSAHDATVLAAGGRVYSLDDLLSADGAFDPLRFAQRSEVGVELAASMLMQVNPWGSRRDDFETPLISALSYGVRNGATCTGEALRTATDQGAAPPEMTQAVFDLAAASPMFRACVGIRPGGQALAVSEGMTLIKVGSGYLNLPEAGTPEHEMTQQQRIAVVLVRMMVFGSAMALSGREGVLILDEAWTMLTSGRTEVDRLGRLARSQQVLPVLLTQKTTDALSAGLAGYISRGIIMSIADHDEAVAALELFRLEPTEDRLARITAPATVGAVGVDVNAAPNWGSFRALRDPATGAVVRGAIGIYVDLAGRAVPVEIRLPSQFLAMASTNPDDIRRRLATRT